MMFSGGSSGSAGAVVSGPSDASVAASTQLQEAQMAASAQAAHDNAQMQLEQSAIAAQVTGAQLQASTQQNQDSLAAQIAELNIRQSNQTAQQQNTLQAQVATATLDMQKQIAQMNEAAQVNAQNVALKMQQSNNQTQLGIVQSMNQTQQGIASTQAYQAIMTKPKSSSCFVTTAICEVLGRSDDCDELVTLRKFRDEWVLHRAWGHELNNHYMIVGPKIVEYIKHKHDRAEYCEHLKFDFIDPCVTAVKKGFNDTALKIYFELVNKCTRDALNA